MKFIVVIFVYLVFLSSSWAENFPRPAELERDVQFWLNVYTQISTRQGYIHDANNLAVVYQKVDLDQSRKANRRMIKNVKKYYAEILKTLATGKRTNLTQPQRDVLALWGGLDADNSKLLHAADNLRFQLGQSNRFREGLIRAGEWRPYIEKTFHELDLPRELTILPHVESSFNPEAYSHVGAAGLWQFIRSTGRRYMQIDYVVDERMDPFAATIAAAKLLQHNYNLTQSWPLALTAYNHGVASMRKAIKTLGTRDIAIIARQYKGRAFGFASRNFYVAFLAALEVDRNPDQYFPKIYPAKPFDYELITLDSYIQIKDIAEALSVPVSVLKRHNRSLLASIWNGNKRVPRGYTLRVPKNLLNAPAHKLLAYIPSIEKHDEQTPDLFHTVVRGDTISEIAQRYGYRVSEVLAANAMRSGHYIRIGQKLRLPVADQKILLDTVAEVKPVQLAKKTRPAQAQKNAQQEATELTQESVNISQAVNLQEAKQDVEVLPAQVDTQELKGLLTDPADYSVDADDKIIVQAEETLGHYAEWLDLRASRLRQINDMRFGTPVLVGRKIKLEFTRIDKQNFEQRRIDYQKQYQEQYFLDHRIDSIYTHTVKRGESLWHLAAKKFKVPMWLLRQHNPDVDFSQIRPGKNIIVPIIKQNN